MKLTIEESKLVEAELSNLLDTKYFARKFYDSCRIFYEIAKY